MNVLRQCVIMAHCLLALLKKILINVKPMLVFLRLVDKRKNKGDTAQGVA